MDIILDDDEKEKEKSKDEGKQRTKKQIKKIFIPNKISELEESVGKWRKNRFVMDPSEIQSYLSKK